MKALKNESDEGRMVHIMEVIKSFKVFGAGGASTSNSTQGRFADITLNHNDDRGVSTTNRDLAEKLSLIPFTISRQLGSTTTIPESLPDGCYH